MKKVEAFLYHVPYWINRHRCYIPFLEHVSVYSCFIKSVRLHFMVEISM